MKYKLVDGEVREKIVLHTFTIADVEDPVVYAAEPIYQWQQTPQGKFCMEKATDLEFHTQDDPMNFGFKVAITGYLSGKNATMWALKKS